jgi:hypothetical protein
VSINRTSLGLLAPVRRGAAWCVALRCIAVRCVAVRCDLIRSDQVHTLTTHASSHHPGLFVSVRCTNAPQDADSLPQLVLAHPVRGSQFLCSHQLWQLCCSGSPSPELQCQCCRWPATQCKQWGHMCPPGCRRRPSARRLPSWSSWHVELQRCRLRPCESTRIRHFRLHASGRLASCTLLASRPAASAVHSPVFAHV